MPKKKTTSARQDGRGGWPTGKRRNPADGWERLRGELLELLDVQYRYGVRSGNVLATVCGVNSGTVTRWLAGEHVPSAETQAAIRAWIAEQRAKIKAEKRQCR